MRKTSLLTTTIFIFSLLLAGMGQAVAGSKGAGIDRFDPQARTPVQQSPEMQTPGEIELFPAGAQPVGTVHEFYGLSPSWDENTRLREPRMPMQQSPERQTPGMVEIYPAGPESLGR